MTNYYLFFAFIALLLCDAVTTHLALQKPGMKEGNKILRWLMDRIGVVPAIIVTRLIYMGIASDLLYMGGEYVTYGLGAMCILFLVVQINNIRLLNK